MTTPEALRLADVLEANTKAIERSNGRLVFVLLTPEETLRTAAELRRLHHNNEVLMSALWKACGDNKDVVAATIESQGELK